MSREPNLNLKHPSRVDPRKVPIAAFPGGDRELDGSFDLMVSKRELVAQLRKENAELKRALEIEGHMDLEGWGLYATQALRDQMAASALVAAGLHPFYALKRLGFKPKEGDTKTWHPVASAVFATPGVRAILDADAEKFSEDKEVVLKRLNQIVKFEDAATATRAASVMAKMIPGWGEGDKGKGSAYIQNFLVSIGEAVGSGKGRSNGEALESASRIIDAEEFLVLDTGEVATVEDAPDTPKLHR